MANQIQMKRILMFGVVLIFTTLYASRVDSYDMTCACANKELCKQQTKTMSTEPEVFVFTGPTTNIHLWRWSAINTLIVPPDFSKSDMMEAETLCITRAHAKKYSISVDFNITGETDTPGRLNSSQPAIDAWRMATFFKESAWRADYLTINLLPYFHADTSSRKEDYAILAGALLALRVQLTTLEIDILCIVPWMPPCSKQDNNCDFAFLIRDACSYFIINPDSFLDKQDSKCVARANIPFSKMLYGISEYNAHFVPSNRLILGVSWHGYDYTCTSLVNNVCHTGSPAPNSTEDGQEVEKQTTCNYDNRKRVSHGDIIQYHAQEYVNHKQDKMNDAPFLNYKDGSVGHQIWFEDHNSLKHKYRLVHELEMKGIAIMYGKDLTPARIPYVLANEGLMWSWLAHEFLLTSTQKPEKENLHWADTVAGVAVGCLILGVVLGIVFTCISMQKRIRKPRHSMSMRQDTDPLGNDYMDDPDL